MKSLVLAFVLVAACSGDDAGETQRDAGELCTSCDACAESLPITGFSHVSGHIDYPDTPPASGDHNGRCWSDWGVIASEVPPERWVHNLEHGGVVFLYRCEGGCDADLTQLRALVNAHPRTLLTSYSQLPTRFAALSWGVRLLSDCLDREAFEAFYNMHVAHGREDIDAPPPDVCARAADPLAL
jgi:hypothetical protein